MRLVTSTTGLPVVASAISAATSAALAKGMARTTTSAARAASAFEVATVEPVAAATAPASSGSRDAIDDVVAGSSEGGGQGLADVAGTDDRDIHGVGPLGLA